MDISTLDILNYVNPAVVGFCLCIGYIIKHSISQIPNKLIPLIMGVIGAICSLAINWPVESAQAALIAVYGGLASGLMSTGLHQAFAQMVGGADSKDGEG